MLGESASVSQVEDQALGMMDMSDRALRATLTRLGEDADEADDDDDAAAAEEDLGEESSKKATMRLESRVTRLERVLIRLADSEDPEGDDDDAGSEDPGEDEESSKKADGKKDDGESKGDQSKTHEDYEGKEEAKKKATEDEEASEDEESKKKANEHLEEEAALLEAMLVEEGMSDEPSLEAMLVEEGMMDAPEEAHGHDGESAGDQSKTHLDYEEGATLDVIEEVAAEPMSEYEEDVIEVNAPDGMDQNDPSSFYEAMGEDPMGMQEEATSEEEQVILASLYGQEAPKKEAAARPRPKKASKGAKRLGGRVQKAAASETSDLSKLWESAPDVSRFF
jgi:hypothetical protein